MSVVERALDVDHIIPRKHGGTDDPDNLQALCWLCNANKGAGDDSDLRGIRDSYAMRQEGCAFCAASLSASGAPEHSRTKWTPRPSVIRLTAVTGLSRRALMT